MKKYLFTEKQLDDFIYEIFEYGYNNGTDEGITSFDDSFEEIFKNILSKDIKKYEVK